jgi:hypothetical protein
MTEGRRCFSENKRTTETDAAKALCPDFRGRGLGKGALPADRERLRHATPPDVML